MSGLKNSRGTEGRVLFTSPRPELNLFVIINVKVTI